MAPGTGWELWRAVHAFTAVLYADMGVQLTLMHWAGGFKHPAMWAPVAFTPVAVGAAAAAAVTREGVVGPAVPVVPPAGAALGVTRMADHLAGSPTEKEGS